MIETNIAVSRGSTMQIIECNTRRSNKCKKGSEVKNPIAVVQIESAEVDKGKVES
jgi:hypothetical protein